MPTGDITRLLLRMRGGEHDALNKLFELVYPQLRRIARGQQRRGGPGHSLNTTELVNEAYLKLVDREQISLEDRKHFFSVAAIAMRQILVDRARRRKADKRGGHDHRTPFREDRLGVEPHAVEIIAINAALHKLEGLDARLAHVVELRFFLGLSVEETAELLEVDPRTVKRDWRKARAFLFHELGAADEG